MKLFKKVEGMLYNYKKTKAEIKNILVEIEEVESSYRGIGSIVYDDMPKAHSINSSIEKEIEVKEQRIEYLNRLMSRKENEIKKIDNALETLTEKERDLIKLRYFEKITHVNIAEAFNLDVSTIYRYKRELIEKLIPLIFIE